jgi:hypothetical protein
VFFGKESENPREEKWVDKPSGEKQNEQPHPKPKPKSIRFHCGYCEERMAKERANKDKYHPSNGADAQAQGKCDDGSGLGRVAVHWSDRCASLVRLVQVWADRGLGLVQEVVVLVVGLESL